MTGLLMSEWLQAFYQHIGTTRQILLTMDGFSAHYAGAELNPPPPNIRICWLPANSTSRFQPLDQGIIQNVKAYYRQHWLQFIIDTIDSNQDPQKLMNLRLALRWIIRAWNTEVLNTTIYNCFRKSTLVSNPISLPTIMTPPGIQELYNKAITTASITDSMAISNFLNPMEEAGEVEGHTTDEELFEEIMEAQLGHQNSQNDDEEEEQPEQPAPTAKEAQHALQVLIDYSERQDALTTGHIRALERLQAAFEAIKAKSQQQATLDRWIT